MSVISIEASQALHYMYKAILATSHHETLKMQAMPNGKAGYVGWSVYPVKVIFKIYKPRVCVGRKGEFKYMYIYINSAVAYPKQKEA